MDIAFNSAINNVRARLAIGASETEKSLQRLLRLSEARPSRRELLDLSALTFNPETCGELMEKLYEGLDPLENEYQVLERGLIILDGMVRNGAERVIDMVWQRIAALQTLTEYNSALISRFGGSGRDYGHEVRRLATALVALLDNTDEIRTARRQAETDREELRKIKAMEQASAKRAGATGGATAGAEFGATNGLVIGAAYGLEDVPGWLGTPAGLTEGYVEETPAKDAPLLDLLSLDMPAQAAPAAMTAPLGQQNEQVAALQAQLQAQAQALAALQAQQQQQAAPAPVPVSMPVPVPVIPVAMQQLQQQMQQQQQQLALQQQAQMQYMQQQVAAGNLTQDQLNHNLGIMQQQRQQLVQQQQAQLQQAQQQQAVPPQPPVQQASPQLQPQQAQQMPPQAALDPFAAAGL